MHKYAAKPVVVLAALAIALTACGGGKQQSAGVTTEQGSGAQGGGNGVGSDMQRGNFGPGQGGGMPGISEGQLQMLQTFMSLTRLDQQEGLQFTAEQAQKLLPLAEAAVAAGELGAEAKQQMEALLTPEQQAALAELPAMGMGGDRGQWQGGGADGRMPGAGGQLGSGDQAAPGDQRGSGEQAAPGDQRGYDGQAAPGGRAGQGQGQGGGAQGQPQDGGSQPRQMPSDRWNGENGQGQARPMPSGEPGQGGGRGFGGGGGAGFNPQTQLIETLKARIAGTQGTTTTQGGN